MVTTRTVGQYVARNAARGESMVAAGYRLAEVNDPTSVEDAIVDLLHLLESIHGIADHEDTDDPRDDTITSVQRAIGHYVSESMYAVEHDDEDSDVLGGIPIWAADVWLYSTDY